MVLKSQSDSASMYAASGMNFLGNIANAEIEAEMRLKSKMKERQMEMDMFAGENQELIDKGAYDYTGIDRDTLKAIKATDIEDYGAKADSLMMGRINAKAASIKSRDSDLAALGQFADAQRGAAAQGFTMNADQAVLDAAKRVGVNIGPTTGDLATKLSEIQAAGTPSLTAQEKELSESQMYMRSDKLASAQDRQLQNRIAKAQEERNTLMAGFAAKQAAGVEQDRIRKQRIDRQPASQTMDRINALEGRVQGTGDEPVKKGLWSTIAPKVGEKKVPLSIAGFKAAEGTGPISDPTKRWVGMAYELKQLAPGSQERIEILDQLKKEEITPERVTLLAKMLGYSKSKTMEYLGIEEGDIVPRKSETMTSWEAPIFGEKVAE